MSLIVIMISVFVLVLLAYQQPSRKSERETSIEVLPATKTVEVEIIDEMTKEKVRNLYEEQDVYNAKISHLMRQNKQYQYEMDKLDKRLENNLKDMQMQLMIQPDLDQKILRAGFEESNNNIAKHKLKLESMILTNAERIVSYKKKSNAISEQITKIGKEVYASQLRRM